eukprot:8275035-Heterocapsa_arctica.AAC.1
MPQGPLGLPTPSGPSATPTAPTPSHPVPRPGAEDVAPSAGSSANQQDAVNAMRSGVVLEEADLFNAA